MNKRPSTVPTFQFGKEDDFDLKSILFKYLKVWPVIIISALLGLAAAYFLNKMSTSIYKVNATVLITDNKSSIGDELFEATGFGQNKSNLQNEIGILKSFSMAEETVEKLNLNVSYFKEDFLRKSQIYGNQAVSITADWSKPHIIGGLIKLTMTSQNTFTLEIEEEGFAVYNPEEPFYKKGLPQLPQFSDRYSFGEVISGDNFSFKVDQVAAKIGEVIYFKFYDNVSLALQYVGRVNIAPIDKSSSILGISIETPIRRLGEDYINQLMETYLAKELKDKNKAAENTVNFIELQLAGIADSLSFIENRLEIYRTQNKIFNLSEEGSFVFQQLQEFEQTRSRTELTLKYYKTLLESLDSEQLNDLVAPSLIGISDPLLNTLVQNLAELQSQLLRTAANYTEQTIFVKDIRAKLTNAKRALEENVNSSIRSTQILLTDTQQKIRRIESQASDLPQTERNLLGIQRQFSISENIYVFLLQKRSEAQITRAANIPKNSILDYAKGTGGAIAPRKSFNLLIGLLIGLLVPIVLIEIRDFFNIKIKDPKQLEKQLNKPVLAMIGRDVAKKTLSVFNSPKTGIAESFRGLRADTSYLAANKDKFTLLFTSSVSGEGKTFVSINMASVFSMVGKKTILIGLDLRKPKIAEEFGLKNDIGVSSCLSTKMSWTDAVKPSGYENLDVLLSGPIPPNPAELLLQPKFEVMLEEIKQQYDVLILDCPPVGLVSETKHFFNFADVSFFMIRQDYSTKENVNLFNILMEKSPDTKLYPIFNDVQINSGYGYGYGYGYGNNSYGYHDDEKPVTWWRRLFNTKK